MAHKITCLVALLVTFSDAEWNTNDYMKREHSLVKPYQGKNLIKKINQKYSIFLKTGSGFGITNWDFLGSTIVTSTHVRLTPNEQSQQGAIWNTQVSPFLVLI